MSQDQAWEEVPVAGERRGLPRAERSGGGQGQSGYSVEGHVGTQAEEVPAAGEERQVQEAIGGKTLEDVRARGGIQKKLRAGDLDKRERGRE